MKRNVPWLQDSLLWLHPGQRLHHEIVELSRFLEPSSSEKQARNWVVGKIETILGTEWPNVEVQPFGSFYTDSYLPTSDIDVVCNGGFSISPSFLRKASKLLIHSDLVELGTLQIITRARIPLIKFVEKTTRFVVDLSFNQSGGIEASERIKELFVQWPCLKPLLLVIKQFLAIRALNNVYSGGLGSYAVTLMIVSFLQLHPMIQSKWIVPEDNLGILLVEFFELYGKSLFYEKVGISILNEGKYLSKAEKTKEFDIKPHLLLVEDPYNPGNNVTKNSFSISAIRQSFGHAFEILSTLLITLGQRQKQGSILSSVVFVTAGSLQHRVYIDNLAGTLDYR